jgi:hypothetical protein
MNDSTVVHLSERGMQLYRSEQLVDIEPVSKVERLYVDIKLGCVAGGVLSIVLAVLFRIHGA